MSRNIDDTTGNVKSSRQTLQSDPGTPDPAQVNGAWWIPSHGYRAQRIVAGGTPGSSLVGVRSVCPTDDGTAVSEDDAALIVRAVNEYDALLALEAEARAEGYLWAKPFLARLDEVRRV